MILAVGIACRRLPAKRLRIATNIWTGYEPLFLGRSLGYFPKEAVHLAELPNATDVSRAFKARVVDMAALTLDETLGLLAEGEDVRIVLVMDTSNGGDALLAPPALPDIRSLKGKRIGVETGALGAYMLTRALEPGGLTLKDIQPVSISLGGHEAAYLSREVDAVITFEPVRSRLLAAGAKVLFDSTQIPGEVMDVLVVHADTLKAHPKEVAAVTTAWFQALDHLHQEPEDAIRRMAPRTGLSPAVFAQALKGIAFPTQAENRRQLEGGLLEPARRLQEVMLQNRLIANPVDTSRLLKTP